MKKLFEPDGIAIAGASTNPTKAGYVALRNMKEKEYPGKVYPINPNETEILGYKCYKALSEIEGNVDLVVLIMPARLIYDIMDDFDKRMEEKHDVKYIVCAAADYAETQTEEGVRRQARLMQSAEKYGVRVIGHGSAILGIRRAYRHHLYFAERCSRERGPHGRCGKSISGAL